MGGIREEILDAGEVAHVGGDDCEVMGDGYGGFAASWSAPERFARPLVEASAIRVWRH